MRTKMYKSPSSWMRRTNGKSQEHLPGPGHPAKTPDIRPLERHPLQQHSRQKLQAPNIRPRQPGHPASPEPPDIWPLARKSGPSEPESNKCHHSSPDIRPPPQPGHPVSPESPEIRPPLSAYSEGPRPVYPFSPLDYIYSTSPNFLGLAKD